MASEQEHTSISATRYSQWFILVTAIFITCLITANITAVKLVGVFGLVLPVSDGVALLPRRLLSEEEVEALLAEGRVVMLTDQYAPVEQMLAPVFLDWVPK
jgi:hypothetical protein